MPRVPRSVLPDGYFHVYCRGVAASIVFPDGADRTAFCSFIRQCERRYEIRIHASTVLSTHYHLVVEARCAELSRALHWLNLRYARTFNKRYSGFGHVFAERFQTRVIEGEEHVFETCAYVLLNPVKAGLCDRVEDWPWSFSRYGLDVT